ncbi:MAG: uracil-DNA glycosylase [Syntrophomonadaceae bacterium]|nr:uracil-DNA glycosylase [Syntrophomonadaceae bacterium]
MLSAEQPGLFDEFLTLDKRNLHNQQTDREYQPVLPGLQSTDAFLEIASLKDLQNLVEHCQKCRLRAGCTRVVFGEGNINARIMLVGEGPGHDEDIQGRPFVGKAGQLLDKILSAIQISREEVYICNVVKCRPPGNRLPSPDEISSCRSYLEGQIRLIKPRIIICLGTTASQSVIDPKAKVTAIRGLWWSRNKIRIIATFHPAALLRNPSYKKPVWEDFKKIKEAYQSLD